MLMKSVSKLSFSVSMFSVLAAHGALAAVTPAQVWENWKAQAEATAYEIKTTSERREGNSLIVEGAVMELNRENESARLEYGRLVFTDRGDGTVLVEMPEEIPFTAQMSEMGVMNAVMSWSGQSLIASGSVDAMRHDITADTFEFTATVEDGDNEDMPGFEIAFGGEGIDGFFVTRGENGKVEDIDSEMTMKVFDFSFEADSDYEDVSFEFSTQDFAFAGTMTAVGAIAQYPEPEQFGDALRAGLSLKAKMSSGKSIMGLFFESEYDGTTTMDAEVESTEFDMVFGAEGFDYSASALGVDMTVSGDTIPLPEVKISMAENTFGFRMPWAESQEQQDFSVLMRLVDLALPEDIWGLFDPVQTLPRDPATLIIDVVGKAKMLGDLFADPEEMEEFPAELHALDLREVQLKMLGADLTGTGAFTFDNSDLETYDGLPRPTGSVDMQLVGGNALLDKAIAMGLVEADEAMGFRMMLALFTRPGDGEDTLVSKIELTEEGGILANGQRLQ